MVSWHVRVSMGACLRALSTPLLCCRVQSACGACRRKWCELAGVQAECATLPCAAM